MHGRRALPWLLAGAWVGTAGAARAQGGGALPPQRRSGDLWFDPTQLPSFTGTVERYLLNPQGEIDALLFREGPQIVFPPDMAEAVRQAAPPGRPLIVWGVRARSAPVITMLAYSPNADATPRIVERPYWRLVGRQARSEAGQLSVAGVVRQPYWSPQGEVVGAVLEDGTVVMLPQGATAEGLRDLLKPGVRLVAERIGENPDALRPVPAPAAAR
jgi:hypothetical protein